MSTVTSSLGRSRNSAQLHVRCRPGRPMEKLHPSRGVCGVGPADRTGKSLVTYWPGGTRPAFSAESWRLRWNPRETGLMESILLHRQNRLHWGPEKDRTMGDKTLVIFFRTSHCDYSQTVQRSGTTASWTPIQPAYRQRHLESDCHDGRPRGVIDPGRTTGNGYRWRRPVRRSGGGSRDQAWGAGAAHRCSRRPG